MPTPTGVVVPFDIATDFLDACGLPGTPESPLKYVTVFRIDPQTSAVLATATLVPALKRLRSGGTFATGGGGKASAETGSFRLWAGYLTGLGAQLKNLDRILDADGVTWSIDGVVYAGFAGFAVCEVTKVRVP